MLVGWDMLGLQSNLQPVVRENIRKHYDTVDGRISAPIDRRFILLFKGFQHVSTIQGGAGFLPCTVFQLGSQTGMISSLSSAWRFMAF